MTYLYVREPVRSCIRAYYKVVRYTIPHTRDRSLFSGSVYMLKQGQLKFDWRSIMLFSEWQSMAIVYVTLIGSGDTLTGT